MSRIYFANALFTQAEQEFNQKVVNLIREKTQFSVYLPQENLAINDKTNFADSLKIYAADKSELDQADVLVAVLDGLTIDNGVCTEIGYFAALNKPIIGLFTDVRKMYDFGQEKKKAEMLTVLGESQFAYINLFVVGAVKANGVLVASVDELIDALNNNKYVKK
ncbi:nucleoside 2-deoxyribosyltransferase [Ureaplasma sp. ES3154-GEN]|uniref:nucleoside 2-deoxyribosyltransferase n=1 Tax=Ureaplasma sp. ES3154-GEN TaxID=2984844 RepID=UPI0021E9429C|nr:nucleoside 2-deoxyribosyltransferase [Ureaplasma sp. ES3154-GEN]MCV3743708.1 nucleoside 2-deoxyribosyltransferase [Ureaplasma sp. ES3154-GEN]